MEQNNTGGHPILWVFGAALYVYGWFGGLLSDVDDVTLSKLTHLSQILTLWFGLAVLIYREFRKREKE